VIQWENIPQELRALAQWVAADSDKHPFSPITGEAASVTDPSTWGSFEDAMAAGLAHVGFVLTKEDPYCVVDLDDPTTRKVNGVTELEPDLERVATIKSRHQEIFEDFDTYAELSQSGTGVHIVCRGSVPQGVRRNKVEVYSDSRYMIFTGNVLKALPITEQQFFVTDLYNTISQDALPAVELQQVASTLSDEEIFNMASTAANSEKFMRLWNGDWHGVPAWPSQSEADFALLAMLGFYSPDNAQVRRMFRWSALGQREKAQKNDRYLNRALSKIRAKTPPPVDFGTLLARGSALVPSVATQAREEAAQQTQAPKGKPPLSKKASKSEQFDFDDLPPGLVGDIARFIYGAAVRQVMPTALAGAIGLVAGIAGRAFNINGTGLNVYIALLAETGSGKESMKSGIDKLFAAARVNIPMIDEFRGPDAFASGQALVKVLDRKPCFVSVLGEFGQMMERLYGKNASSSDKYTKSVLLNVYGKSGHENELGETVYSDGDKNTKRVVAPNVTLIGESNPSSFYKSLGSEQINDGFLTRFTVIEYTGKCPYSNYNRLEKPSIELVRGIETLAHNATTNLAKKTCTNVAQNPEATQLLRGFDTESTDNKNETTGFISSLWVRAHLKALKLAGLIAVGVNPHKPIITSEIADWAIRFTKCEISHIKSKFERGETGSGDDCLERHAIRAIGDYFKINKATKLVYGCSRKAAESGFIPYTYIRNRLRSVSDFKDDRRGSSAAIKATIFEMKDAGMLIQVPLAEAKAKYDCVCALYALGPDWKD
jgi:hypothetical protein